MRAAIYYRFSTEKQDARSIEDQERRCRAFARTRGYDVALVYSDAGVSGTTTARPGLQQLLTDARARRFRAVLVDDLSRLSRNRTDSDVLVRDLGDLGATVVDTETGASSDDEASDVVFALKGIVNDQYVKAIRRQTHRGLEGRALQGFHIGGRTFGYASVEEPSPADPTKPAASPSSTSARPRSSAASSPTTPAACLPASWRSPSTASASPPPTTAAEATRAPAAGRT